MIATYEEDEAGSRARRPGSGPTTSCRLRTIPSELDLATLMAKPSKSHPLSRLDTTTQRKILWGTAARIT